MIILSHATGDGPFKGGDNSMVLTNQIRGLMVMRGYNITSFAEALKMTPKTLSTKLQSGNFSVDEANLIIELLDIENPGAIFFAKQSPVA